MQKSDSWEDFYTEGKQYVKIVYNTDKDNDKFTPEILYNIACMGIEKLFMAYFVKTGNLPYNHTLQDLVECIKQVRSIPEELEHGLMHMNGFQEICSIDNYNRLTPSWSDIADFIETVKLTEKFIQDIL